jgi:hypothetical protein
VNSSCNLVHFQKAMNSAALVLLLLNLLREAFTSALFDAVGVGESPACLAICLTYFLARVTALLISSSVAATAIVVGSLARYSQCSAIADV